jgi:hypothetical protein
MKINLLSVRPEDEKLWRLCEGVEYEVFLEQGYIASNSFRRIHEFDRYRQGLFIAAVREESGYPPCFQDITGVMRFIHSTDESRMKKGLFPTIDASDRLKISVEKRNRLMSIDPRNCMDLSSIAIRRQHRGTDTGAILSEYCLKCKPEIQYILAAIDSRIHKVLKRYLLVMQELGPPVYYWGSLTTAVLIDRYLQF